MILATTLVMLVVIAAFFGMVLTERMKGSSARTAAIVVWMFIVVGGWLALAYIALAVPGGLDAAWEWARSQPLWYQVAMWLFLLPWMGAVWIWQLPWAAWIRVSAIVALAAFTIALSAGQKR